MVPSKAWPPAARSPVGGLACVNDHVSAVDAAVAISVGALLLKHSHNVAVVCAPLACLHDANGPSFLQTQPAPAHAFACTACPIQAHLAALLDADAVPAPLLEPSTGGARASLDGAAAFAAAGAAGGLPAGVDSTSAATPAAVAAAAGVSSGGAAAVNSSDPEPSPSRSSMDGAAAAAAELARQPSGRSSFDGQRGSWSGGEALLESPLIGKLTLRRLGFSLKLDEKRLTELLRGTAQVRGAALSGAAAAACLCTLGLACMLCLHVRKAPMQCSTSALCPGP
jgi:hypothetical protein